MYLPTPSRVVCVCLMGLVCGCWMRPLAAQEFLDDEPLEFAPGLVASYRWPEGQLVRLDADIAGDWSRSRPVTQMPPDSSFAVVWEGQLHARENGAFQLCVYASGRVKVELAGQELLSAQTPEPTWLIAEPLELRYGHHALRVEFESTSPQPRIGLFWSGPSFALEPISARYLFHRPASLSSPPAGASYHTGQLLARGLRCGACHTSGSQLEPLPAPALTHLRGNLHPSWLIQRLMQPAPVTPTATDRREESSPAGNALESRMPHFGLSREDAAAIAAALITHSADSPEPEPLEAQLQAANQRRGRKDPEIRFQASAEQGEVAFVSIGCPACHQSGPLGQPQELSVQLFGGGDLNQLAAKRTPDFVRRWLGNPAEVNPDHHMPVFDLSRLERLDLQAYLVSLDAPPDDPRRPLGDPQRGVALIAEHRCSACHQLPAELVKQLPSALPPKTPLSPESHWDGGCLTAADASGRRPGGGLPNWGLNADQRQALRLYLTTVNGQSESQTHSADLLQEKNCLACHSRELHEGLKSQLPAIAAAVGDVAARLAALAPPSLTAVGDKYHTPALKEAIARTSAPLRPWLDVRMPKFRFAAGELEGLADALVAHDRIPDAATAGERLPSRSLPLDQLPSDTAARLAAGRLVTADGFGCQSCHPIGPGEAPKVDLNARGTDLAMLGQRVRPDWFSRWVRNPARIVPRMEMPAIQTAVKGVLEDSLDLQLAALWSTLNTPDFRPPRPSPVRVVRTHNLPDLQERAWLLTDVLETPAQHFLRPLVFALPNRQNLLFDLEAGRLAAWWLGDAAHQHTRGKTWYWEAGASLLNATADAASGANSLPPLEQIELIDGRGASWSLTPHGQFAARLDRVEHIPQGIRWHGRLHFRRHAATDAAVDAASASPGTENAAGESGQHLTADSRWLTIVQTVRAAEMGQHAASVCQTQLGGLQPGERVRLSTLGVSQGPPRQIAAGSWQAELQSANTLVTLTSGQAMTGAPSGLEWSVASEAPPASSQPATASSASLGVEWTSTYRTRLPTDQFPRTELPPATAKTLAVHVVPGFEGTQLPLPPTEMPISFAWDATGRFFAGSLKGRVLEIVDADDDGWGDRYELISDEIPTPFGLYAHESGVDALAKYALLRLTPSAVPGAPYDAQVVADGWGYTADYHDWAIGLERDPQGNYYMALPCQQDDRSQEAAYLRGQALKLIPSQSPEDPRMFRIEPLAAGLRFPIGIALNRDQALFTSDNQGNYNPFNELNHLRPGKRYGFINKLENKDGFSPPFESPAINLPHPWTRSVNGICFLTTPAALAGEQPHFGAFEGHLIGCEMNGKSLVRMSLQKVGDTYQGAAYMFSRPVQPDEVNLEGPIVCEISPEGDLMVGSLQDSGWSGGQNTGSIVRFRPTGRLPLGIAEVRGTATGFEIDFTQPVDAAKAAQAEHYQLRSYLRVSTPAYGGDDQDERFERVERVEVSADGRRVHLFLPELREGCVYELNVAPLGGDGEELFPSQAHYTMRAIPH